MVYFVEIMGLEISDFEPGLRPSDLICEIPTYRKIKLILCEYNSILELKAAQCTAQKLMYLMFHLIDESSNITMKGEPDTSSLFGLR